MKKLGVYFKELRLGDLVFDGVNYCYKANKNNIKKAISKGYPVFLHECEQDFRLPVLPASFQELLPSDEKFDIIMMAGITDADSDFEKLLKIASLNLAHSDFHIEI